MSPLPSSLASVMRTLHKRIYEMTCLKLKCHANILLRWTLVLGTAPISSVVVVSAFLPGPTDVSWPWPVPTVHCNGHTGPEETCRFTTDLLSHVVRILKQNASREHQRGCWPAAHLYSIMFRVKPGARIATKKYAPLQTICHTGTRAVTC
jgi:hypothetical protein